MKRPKRPKRDFWQIVDAVAGREGIKKCTRYKWKSRGAVPAARHIPLIDASIGKLCLDDFRKMTSAG